MRINDRVDKFFFKIRNNKLLSIIIIIGIIIISIGTLTDAIVSIKGGTVGMVIIFYFIFVISIG